MSTAPNHVTTNMATMIMPALLMSNPDMNRQNEPFQWSSWGKRPKTSMAPMKKQIATDRPVIARL